MMKYFLLILFGSLITSCATHQSSGNVTTATKAIPQQEDRGSLKQIIKNDFDRMADIEVRQNIESLRLLMLKLYKRNPQELKKSHAETPEQMIAELFDHEKQHQYQFSALQNAQSTDAIFLAFKPQFEGDRVFAYIVGLHTMLLKAHGSKDSFYLTDNIEPQYIYNVARNVEIAAWKLANSRDKNDKLYLLSNELNNNEKNLTIEREFGKIIGRTDLYAIALAEKSQRTITHIIQNIATALFLPI